MSLLRCSSPNLDGERCRRIRFHRGGHFLQRDAHTAVHWGRDTGLRRTYETTAPWVTWAWLSTDHETRVTGRSRMRLTCAVCGQAETIRIRIPRIGKVPEPPNGMHPARSAAIQRHAHPDRGHPMSWALPMLNPAAHQGGLDLSLLSMRLEADVNAVPATPEDHDA